MMICMRTLIATLLFYSISSSASPITPKPVQISSQGATKIVGVFGKDEINVTLMAHELNIGKPSDEIPKQRLTNCTYSRMPCSLVDLVEIVVNGKALFIPRSVFSDLADVSRGEVKKLGGSFILSLHGGDASESYTVNIIFDKQRIRQRNFMSNLDREITEKTTYSLAPPMD